MNGVIGMSGVLLDPSLNDDQRDVATTIRDSGQALLTIIHDILDFSKIEAGRMDVESRPFTLRPCIDSAAPGLHVSECGRGERRVKSMTCRCCSCTLKERSLAAIRWRAAYPVLHIFVASPCTSDQEPSQKRAETEPEKWGSEPRRC